MPINPKDEVVRRRELRKKEPWHGSLYHGEPRHSAVHGNISVVESHDPETTPQRHIKIDSKGKITNG
jgi:hypothetical protein